MTLFAALRLPGEILFGKGQRHALPAVAKKLGKTALICTDERFAGTGIFTEIKSGLESAGIELRIHDSVEPDVPRDSVAACVDGLGDYRPDMIIGIGGGSCLDFAKCTALLMTHGGALADYYGEFKVPGPTIPLIAIPTTSGTGSEVTPVAVVSDKNRAVKVGIASPHLIPHTAICDPELTYGCPSGLTAVSGADALTHAIEAFTTARRAPDGSTVHDHVFVGKNTLSDFYALEAIRLIGASLPKAVHDTTDRAARADMMRGATLAGLAFGAAGTAAAHAVQYPVGALTHTAHGVGVAAMMPYVMEFNLPLARPEMAEIAVALGLNVEGLGEAERAAAAIDGVADLFAGIGIPANIGLLGVAEDQLDWIAEQALAATRLVKNNPRPLDAQSMARLVRAAYHGDRASLRD